jgi:hypothetical protein
MDAPDMPHRSRRGRRQRLGLNVDLQRPPVGLARPEGLEPPAYRFEACCSIQLSYERGPSVGKPKITRVSNGVILFTIVRPENRDRAPAARPADMGERRAESGGRVLSDTPGRCLAHVVRG